MMKKTSVVMFRSINTLNTKGMSLLSVLFAISTLIILTPILVGFISLMDSIQPTEGIQDLEFHQLHFTIDRELKQTDEIAIYSNAIHLYKQDGKHVIYEVYGDIIRRRVDYSGHEYILLDVNTFNVNYIQDGIFTITCERSDGTIYEKTYYEDPSKIINITS